MENDQLELLGSSLKASILDNDIASKLSTAINLTEIIVDLAVQLPVFDTINKIRDNINNYNAFKLHKKLTAFLFGISDISLQDRMRFMEELDSKKELREKSGDVLLDIIVRINQLGKIDILINLFKANVAGKMDIGEFLRLTMTLEKISIVDLHELKNYDLETNSDTPGRYDGSLTDSLYAAGLLNISVIGGDDGTLFNINHLGKKMLLLGLINA